MWDKRAQAFFKSEDEFLHGLKLLNDYLKLSAQNLSFDEISRQFLDSLDDVNHQESKLLQHAIDWHNAGQLVSGVNPHNSLSISNIEAITKLLGNANSQTSNSSQPTLESKKLSIAHEEFLSIQRHSWKATSNSERAHIEVYKIFYEITGDIESRSLKKEHVSTFSKIILNYPANKNKKKQYCHLAPLDFLDTKIPNSEKLSPTTVKKYFTILGQFLCWLKDMDLTAIDLDIPIKKIKISHGNTPSSKPLFSCEELRKIFNSREYLSGIHDTPSKFWVPLIAIYTGARLNEICQLSVSDVYQETKQQRYVFDFNQNSDIPHKTLKKPIHARLVPVHKILIELGLLEYLNEVKKHSKQIFPDLKYSGAANKYGGQLQKWFNRTYLNSKHCNITTPHASFHSLRHNVVNQFSVTHRLTENQVARGLGQTPKGGVFERTYSKQELFESYARYFDLLDFSKCFDHKLIKSWKLHMFWKNRP